jgi:hypothetical protein
MSGFTEEELKALGMTVEGDDAADLVSKFGIPLEDLDAAEVPAEDVPVAAPQATLKPSYDSAMFDGMKFEDAMQRYSEILKDPDVTAPVGGAGYAFYTDPETQEKTYISPPDISYFRPGEGLMSMAQNGLTQGLIDTFEPRAKTDAMDKLALGATESAGDAAEMVAAGVDKVAGTNLSETVDKATPDVDTGSDLTDALIADGGPALLAAFSGGMMAKNALAAALPVAKDAGTAVKLLTDTIKAVGIATTSEVAAASTVGTNEGTIFMGDTAIMPLLKGVDLGDSRADAVIEQRLNTLTEGLFLGSAIAGVATTSKAVGSFAVQMTVAPALTVLRGEPAIERRMYDEIMSKLVNITDASTPEEIAAARREIARVVNENKEVTVRLMQDADQSKPIQLDTVSALLRGIDNPEQYNRAVGIRAGQLNQGAMSPQLNAAIQRPKAELAAETDAYLRSVGGDTPADQTAAMGVSAEEFADQGRRTVDDLGGALSKAQADYDASVAKLLDGYAQDVEFGQKVMDLEGKVGTEVVTPRANSLTSIQDGLRTGYETMKAQKDVLYASVDGGQLDVDLLLQPLDDILEIENISKAGVAVKSNSPLRKLLTIAQRRQVEDVGPNGQPIMRSETDAERSLRVTDTFSQNGIDFGFLYRQIRPELSLAASNLYDAQMPAAGQQVRDLVHFIDGPMIDSVRATDPDVAQAAEAARDYYKNEFAPIWRSQGKMQEFAELYDGTIGRTDGTDLTSRIDGTGFSERGFREQDYVGTTNILNSGNPEEVRNLAEVLNSNRPDSAEDIMDYMIFDAIEKMSKGGNLEDLDVAGITSALRQNAMALNEVFPQKAGTVNAFLAQLDAAGKDKAKLKAIVDSTAERAKIAKDEVMQSELRFFINDHPWAAMGTTSNPYEAFRQVFGSKEGTARVSNLMDAVNALPPGRQDAVRNGMETAYFKYMQENLFGSKLDAGGEPAMKSGVVQKTNEELRNDLLVGRALFADKPEVMEALTALMETANFIERNKSATPITSMSPTAFNQEAMKSVQRSIYMTVGPLNRLGTQIRSLSGMVFDKMDATGKSKVLMDRMFADPEYFMTLARRFGDTPDNEYYAKAFADYIVRGDPRGLGQAAMDTTSGLRPIDEVNRAILSRGAVSGYLKTDRDDPNAEASKVDSAFPDFLTPDFLQDELDAMGQAVNGVRGALEEEVPEGFR